MDVPDQELSPGWDAINAALEPLYGATEPLHWGVILHARIGGPDYIDGISAYRSPAYAPHWHFITYGFSELYSKESDVPDVSGFGFELTFRNKSPDAPMWALGHLQNLGRYVHQTGNAFAAGHYMNLNSAIALRVQTDIRAITFVHDPQLPETIETPNGSLQFLQVVGITLDELQAIKCWNSGKFLAAASDYLPGFITDLDRKSLLRDPDFKKTVDYAIGSEGSSTGALHVTNVQWRVSRSWLGSRRLTVTMGANGVSDLIAILPARISFQRKFALAGKQVVSFLPAETFGWEEVDAETVRIALSARAAFELSQTLQVKAGEYNVPSLPSVTIVVEPSTIKDADGNIVDHVG
jgi:suppressor of fused